MRATQTISNARRSVSARLAPLELPEAFQLATISAASNSLDRTTVVAKASRRRLVDKATRLASKVSP
jgi:uncharacterized coiled-coil protein SlyX